jgi:hypothetical protein
MTVGDVDRPQMRVDICLNISLLCCNLSKSDCHYICHSQCLSLFQVRYRIPWHSGVPWAHFMGQDLSLEADVYATVKINPDFTDDYFLV